MADTPSSLNMSNEASPPPLFNGPSVSEVLSVKRLLLTKLPLEIIDAIIDHAEYWPHTTITTEAPTQAPRLQPGESDSESDVFVIRSLPLCCPPTATPPLSLFSNLPNYHHSPNPLDTTTDSSATKTITSSLLNTWPLQSRPRTLHPCRKIVFTIKSADQGWGGNPNDQGTYHGSFTWFDVGLERVEALDASSTLAANPDQPANNPTPLDSRSHHPDHEPPTSSSPSSPSPSSSPPPSSPPPSSPSSPSSSSSPIYTLRHLLPPLLPHPDNPDHPIPVTVTHPATTTHPATITHPTHPSNPTITHPFLPPPTRLQSNPTAQKEPTTHTVTWSHTDAIDPASPAGDALEEEGRGRASGTGEYVRGLVVGDVVTVWARARFPGWVNRVEEVGVGVWWCV